MNIDINSVPADDNPYTVHKNNIPWHKAPLPRRFHRCKVWTHGYISGGMIERCACGAIRVHSINTMHLPAYWYEKNNRRAGGIRL